MQLGNNCNLRKQNSGTFQTLFIEKVVKYNSKKPILNETALK